GGDRAACVARAVGLCSRAVLAVEALRENARHRRLAGAARAGEEIRLPHLAAGDRVLQRPDDGLLADHFGEGLRAVLAVEGGHGSIQADRSARARTAMTASARGTAASVPQLSCTSRSTRSSSGAPCSTTIHAATAASAVTRSRRTSGRRVAAIAAAVATTTHK